MKKFTLSHEMKHAFSFFCLAWKFGQDSQPVFRTIRPVSGYVVMYHLKLSIRTLYTMSWMTCIRTTVMCTPSKLRVETNSWAPSLLQGSF